MALPTFVNALTSDNVTGTTLTAAVPSGTAVGDILLAYVGCVGSSATFTASTNGGTKVAEYQVIQSGIFYRITVAVFWFRCTTSVPSSMVYTMSTTGNAGAGVVAIRGCINAGVPYDFYTMGNGPTGSTNTVNIPAMDTSSYGADRLLVDGHMWTTRATPVSSGPSLYTNQGDVGVGSSVNMHAGVFTRNAATAGSYSADSATISANEWKVGYNFAMKPPLSGYANKVNGVVAANIGKVNNVATASIGNVIGV